MFSGSDTFTDTEARDASPIILREPELKSRAISPTSLYVRPLAGFPLGNFLFSRPAPDCQSLFLLFRKLPDCARYPCIVKRNVFLRDALERDARDVQTDLFLGGRGGGSCVLFHAPRFAENGKNVNTFLK